MQSTPVSEAVVPEQPQEETPVIVDEVAPEVDLVEEEIATETESEDSDVKN